MSAIKPIFREVRQAAVKAAGDLKDRFRGVADNLNVHFTTVGRRVNDQDRFDSAPDAPNTTNPSTALGNGNGNGNTNGGDGSVYSVAYQMQLDPDDWARSRSVHFNRSNADLDAAMQADPDFRAAMEAMSPGISDRVTRPGGRQNPNPEDFIWHHAHPNTVGGQNGVMQLVPTYQHTPGSDFWSTLHPGNRGGFAIWGEKK
ncbi:HNH endonuclease [Microbacterium dauci]|uniref:HNH endonuclease n=1 Tax=Microbacterium dauci TaxID=3048008 RepID=A0ABT6ZEM2_9MICO|nr:HNH endonuclease [Microbacterium sp. LX3-4]MDJ1114605.1 HNH endonuclease [Microbacterium sp. LX3-4]